MAKEKIRCDNCGRLLSYEAKSVTNHEVACETCKHNTPVVAKAVARFIRTSPRKLRLIADAIRGKQVKDALLLLRFTPKRAAKVLYKIVESAKANAENTYQMNPDDLMIYKIVVDGGPTLKRFMPRAMGRAAGIHKRTSHVTVNLRSAIEPIQPKKKAPAAQVKKETRATAKPKRAKKVKE